MSDKSEYGPDERTSINQTFKEELYGDESSLSFDRGKWLKPFPKRYILTFMMFLGTCNLYMMRVNMSVAVVAMVNNHTEFVNGTEVVVADFDWSPGVQGILLGAFYWGYAITQIPGGWLSSRFGGKILYGCGVLFTGIFTILTPGAAILGGLPLLVALRILEGLFEGVTYPCIHTLLGKWAPPLERTRLVTVAFSGSHIGTVISMPLSGVIADNLGWSWIFYIFGSVALLWFVFWCWLAVESPIDHASISCEELEYITDGNGMTHTQPKDLPTPWKEILTSLPFWSITVANVAEHWGFYTLLTELPTFLSDIMHFNLSKAGVLSAIPYLAMVIIMQGGGHLADLIRSRDWLNTTAVRKLFNCSGFIAQVVFMISAAYTTTSTSAVICLTFAVGLGGLAWCGFCVNPLDIAPQYAGLMWGIANTCSAISGIIAPVIAGFLTMNRTVDEWRHVFYLSAGIYCFGAVFYGLFASGNLQPWADSSAKKRKDEDRPPSAPADIVEFESGPEELK